MISLVNFVLTSVNAGFTGASMEITIRDLAVVMLISGPVVTSSLHGKALLRLEFLGRILDKS